MVVSKGWSLDWVGCYAGLDFMMYFTFKHILGLDLTTVIHLLTLNTVLKQDLLSMKRRKLAWFGNVTHHYSLSKAILQGTLGAGRCCDWQTKCWMAHGWQRKCWMDNIKERKYLNTCPCQNCSQGPPVEKTGRGFLLNRPLCPHDDPFVQGTELN